MKRIIPYLFLPIFLLCISACHNKTKNQEKKQTVVKDTVDSIGIQRMQESTSKQVVKMNGVSYNIELHRAAKDSLTRIKTEAGEWFADNVIHLKIVSGKDKKVIDKSFTKKSFSSIVPADFLSHSILEGMVFDKVTNAGLCFAASVCYPQTDLYFPIKITITTGGSISMTKEEMMEDNYPEDKD